MPILEVYDPTIQTDCTCVDSKAIYMTGKQTCINLFVLSQSQEDSKEDLLRAVLLFACSTIDSVGKQLTKDCLTELINSDEGAQKTFETYVARQINKEPHKVLARALSKPDYRGELIQVLKESFDRESLQSYQQISSLTAQFGVVTDSILSRAVAEKIFDTRQKIVHEMDIESITSGGTAAQRRTRAESELKEQAEQVLKASKLLIEAVHNKIHEPRAQGTGE